MAETNKELYVSILTKQLKIVGNQLRENIHTVSKSTLKKTSFYFHPDRLTRLKLDLFKSSDARTGAQGNDVEINNKLEAIFKLYNNILNGDIRNIDKDIQTVVRSLPSLRAFLEDKHRKELESIEKEKKSSRKGNKKSRKRNKKSRREKNGGRTKKSRR
jgi:hypothetical protein